MPHFFYSSNVIMKGIMVNLEFKYSFSSNKLNSTALNYVNGWVVNADFAKSDIIWNFERYCFEYSCLWLRWWTDITITTIEERKINKYKNKGT